MHPFFALREQLPALAFDPDRDQSVDALTEGYRSFYQLDFTSAICSQYCIGTFSAADYQCVAQYWLPASTTTKGTVFVVHGYFDHVGLYRHLIQNLLQQGFAVVAFDLPGHGLSSGEPASIGSFSEYVEVLEHCTKLAQAMPCPRYYVGQSTGCAILIQRLLIERKLNPFDRVVFLAPLLRPAHWASLVWVYRLLVNIIKKMPRRVAQNSNDDDFVRFVHHHDPLQAKHYTTAWLHAMQAYIHQSVRAAPVDCDVLIIQGDADTTVDAQYNTAILSKKLRGSIVSCLAKGRHHLVNERQDLRKQVFSQVNKYLLASK